MSLQPSRLESGPPANPDGAAQAADLAALIAAAGTGDRAAFEKLYHATAPKLLAMLIRLARSRGEAEEILQDVYVRVWTRARDYSPEPGAAFAWLVSIARNRAIDVIRMKIPLTLKPNEDGTDWLDRIVDGHDHEAALIERNSLAFCLEKIEQPVRDMILLAYHEGFSREELAKRYDRPVNTIKTWLHRGLAALTSCLRAHA